MASHLDIYRVGRKVPRHVYRGDTPLFTAESEAEAVTLVQVLNAGARALATAKADHEAQASRDAERVAGLEAALDRSWRKALGYLFLHVCKPRRPPMPSDPKGADRAALADELESVAEKATPRPWRRNREAATDDDYLTGPNGEHLIRRDAKLMQLLANNLDTILATLRPASEPTAGDGAEER